MVSPRLILFLPIILVMGGIYLTACEDKKPPNPTPPIPEVSVGRARVTSEPVTTELPGRLEAYRQAEVRARVAGIVIRRLYEEGQEVKKGTPLFRIDPAPLKAAYEAAAGQLASAQANYLAAEDRFKRYKSLLNDKAVSELEFTGAQAEEARAKALVLSAKASLESARLQLSYSNVTSPIDGRARRALVTEGALVGLDSPTPLTIVEQIDPIYVNFSQPAGDVMQIRRGTQNGKLEAVPENDTLVHITLPDGSEYARPGKLLFSDLAVNSDTDTVAMRAEFPNPDRELLPGSFVTVRMVRAINTAVVLVPRDALLRGLNSATVMIVNDENKVEAVPVKADALKGKNWLVTEGLSGGERIVLSNPGMLVSGTQVKAVTKMDGPIAGERDSTSTTTR